MFGMEAALFCPSGTMTNQIAIKCHTQPGDEVICDELSHVYQYEGGGIAFNSGCSVRLLHCNRGRLTAQQVEAAINPDDVHKPVSRLVSIENTANRGGGSCYDFAELERIQVVCRQHGLGFHLDGARLWNALVAKNETPRQYGQLFDSISVCLSKGLGTPVGSLLLGKKDFIKKARRVRKVLGGGMRQAGFLAAAGIYALEHNIERLVHDHAHARRIGEALAKQPWVKEVLPVETNILIFEVMPDKPASFYTEAWKQRGVLCLPVGPQSIRMVFHLGVSSEQVDAMPDLLQLQEA
jgi:threonine aldolase